MSETGQVQWTGMELIGGGRVPRHTSPPESSLLYLSSRNDVRVGPRYDNQPTSEVLKVIEVESNKHFITRIIREGVS